MTIKEYKINNNNYTFVCESWETSRAWGHRVTLLKNNYEITRAKMTYVNRTWENYQYQSCMLNAIGIVMDELEEELKAEYKKQNNITRITKKHKDPLENYISSNEKMQELIELRTQVRGKVW